MSQLTLITNLPDAAEYPNLIKHTELMMTKPDLAENLGKARAMLGMAVKETVDLGYELSKGRSRLVAPHPFHTRKSLLLC
ncbi:MAG: hypothetical protein AAGH57_08310 [Pseudomonadota bacterium]